MRAQYIHMKHKTRFQLIHHWRQLSVQLVCESDLSSANDSLAEESDRYENVH